MIYDIQNEYESLDYHQQLTLTIWNVFLYCFFVHSLEN